MPFGQHHRYQDSKKCKHGTHGKIDTAGYDDDTHTNTEDPIGADQPAHVLNVCCAEKLWVEEAHHTAKDNQQNENSDLFSHRPSGHRQTHQRLFRTLRPVEDSSDPSV